jgi:hypothetical protein
MYTGRLAKQLFAIATSRSKKRSFVHTLQNGAVSTALDSLDVAEKESPSRVKFGAVCCKRLQLKHVQVVRFVNAREVRCQSWGQAEPKRWPSGPQCSALNYKVLSDFALL